MKDEKDLDGVARVKYHGRIYDTGNRRHNDVELYLNGKFVRTVRIGKCKRA